MTGGESENGVEILQKKKIIEGGREELRLGSFLRGISVPMEQYLRKERLTPA